MLILAHGPRYKFILALLYLVALCAVPAVAECRFLIDDLHTDPATSAKKTEFALAVISNRKYLEHDKLCFSAAVHYLGEHRITAAIPQMIQLIGTPLNPITFMPDVFKRFPVIGSLAYMGKPAEPGLLRVIKENDASSDAAKNALLALSNMKDHIHHEVRLISLLQDAADKETEMQAADRLRMAAEYVKLHYCRTPDCGEDQARSNRQPM